MLSIMSLPSMGNPRVDAAASRLNTAFIHVTQKIEALQNQLSEHPEIDLLETENMRLHKENAELKARLIHANDQINKILQQIEQMMEPIS